MLMARKNYHKCASRRKHEGLKVDVANEIGGCTRRIGGCTGRLECCMDESGHFEKRMLFELFSAQSSQGLTIAPFRNHLVEFETRFGLNDLFVPKRQFLYQKWSRPFLNEYGFPSQQFLIRSCAITCGNCKSRSRFLNQIWWVPSACRISICYVSICFHWFHWFPMFPLVIPTY